MPKYRCSRQQGGMSLSAPRASPVASVSAAWVLLAAASLLLLGPAVVGFALPSSRGFGQPAAAVGHLADSRRSAQWASSAAPAGALAATTAALCGAALSSATRRKAAATQRRGWGDDVVFHEAAVQSNVEAAKGLRLITIDAPVEVSDAFAKAGQFVQAKPAADAKPSFYAISSPPQAGTALEFLIKEADANAWLTNAKGGDALQLSAAMGRGFSLDCESWTEAEVSQVGLFATGSGIAPMRAAIESGALAGKVCRLYFGAREEGTMAYTDRFDEWKNRGVEVVPVLSRGGDDWTGEGGYVQDAFKRDEERGEGFVLAARHGALLCGQKEMVAAVRGVYADLGVPEERTLLNF